MALSFAKIRCISAITAVCLITGCGKADLTMNNSAGGNSDETTNVVSSEQPVTSAESSAAESNISSIAESSSDEPVVYGSDFVGCKAAICYDLTESEIIYSKNPDMTIYPASTTKILTALTAIEFSSADYEYYIGDELDLVAEDSSMSWITYGTTMRRNEILTAMLTPSGNDAAYSIAANIGRKIYGEDLSTREAVDYFCVLMTDYGKKLGAASTSFTVPDGYHSDTHYTTASDMLLFAIAAANSPTICGITSQPLAVVYDEQGGVHSWNNGNILLEDTSLPYSVYGLKTGYTDEAGFCFIGLAEMDGKKIITLTFDCELEYRFADTRKLMDLGFGLYDPDYDYCS